MLTIPRPFVPFSPFICVIVHSDHTPFSKVQVAIHLGSDILSFHVPKPCCVQYCLHADSFTPSGFVKSINGCDPPIVSSNFGSLKLDTVGSILESEYSTLKYLLSAINIGLDQLAAITTVGSAEPNLELVIQIGDTALVELGYCAAPGTVSYQCISSPSTV